MAAPLAAVLSACALFGLLSSARAQALDGGEPVPLSNVDGISDQSLARWDGGFATSALGAALRTPFGVAAADASEGRVRLARYVVQWDALLPSGGAGAEYGPRFDAWLSDVGGAGLVPVLALTSYDGVYPASPGAYEAGLRMLLARALALGRPIAWVEPWNEPNGQGRLNAAVAASYANVADTVCAGFGAAACGIVAGDFEDLPGADAYARAYVRALAFAPRDWGVHPYLAAHFHDTASVLALKAALPDATAGLRLWFTEVAALYCRQGEVRGESAQAADAAYLVQVLMRDRAIAPVHVFYFGLEYRDRAAAPCTPAGGDDGELFAPGGEPRPAARIVFPRLAGDLRAAAFGPGPGLPPVG